MPQLVVLALVGAGAFLAGRALGRMREDRKKRTKHEAASNVREPRDLGHLRRDPSSGEYRPD